LRLFAFFAEAAMRTLNSLTGDIAHHRRRRWLDDRYSPRRTTMNVQKFIAAAAVFVAAGSAFAADAPAAVAAPAVASAASSVLAANLNLPVAGITKSAGPVRADVRAEAVQFVQNHKTALAVQLEQYKN
jgi:hypothetical protein